MLQNVNSKISFSDTVLYISVSVTVYTITQHGSQMKLIMIFLVFEIN